MQYYLIILIPYTNFITLVLSMLLYGCETWTLMEESKEKIHAFESKSRR